MTTDIVSKILAIAKGEVGFREGPSNRQKYAPGVPSLEWAQNQPWCASFVAWVALKAGVPGLYPVTASCDVAGNWFKARGRWSEYPAIGAQVFFGTPADLNHTGIVVAYTPDSIVTVEGNTNDDGSREGDGVYQKVRPRRGTNIVGYGYPQFPQGIVSADPRFAGELPDSDYPRVRKSVREARADAKKAGLTGIARRLGAILTTIKEKSR